MTGEGAPDRASERRVRRWSLAAVALLLPLAFAENAWRSAGDYLSRAELKVVRAGPGGEADYAGARWRLSHFRVLADDPDPRLRPPPDRALVLVRLKARVAEDVGMGWYVCNLALVDAAGRRWAPMEFQLPNAVRKLVEPGGASPPPCAQIAIAQPKAGTEVEFGQQFVVPRDAVPTLEVRFSVRAGRPEVLALAP